MGINLIKSSYQFKIKNFINLGSSCIYPPNLKNPLKKINYWMAKLKKQMKDMHWQKFLQLNYVEYISLNKIIIICHSYHAIFMDHMTNLMR